MKRRGAIGLICIGILAIVALLLKPRERQERLLSDGSTLVLTKVKFGATNTFTHGRALEKLFGRLIPASGASFRKFTLSRPTVMNFWSPWVTTLTAQFRLQPVAGQSKLLVQSSRSFRWVIQGEDQMRYIQEFRDFERHTEGFFSYINTGIFPRNARRLTVRLEEREGLGGTWKELAEFSTKGPAPHGLQPWSAPPPPMTTRIDDMEFTFGETTFRLEPRNTNDIWACKMELQFQVRRGGEIQTNWSADYFVFEDASGNADRMGALKNVTNGWLIYDTWRSLDPKYVWRINVDFGLDSGWPATNLCTMRIPIPLNSPIKTNFNGVPLVIDFVNGDMLAVQMPTNRTDLRLTFIGANDGGGPFRTGSWSQHGFWKKLELPPAGSTIEATFAVDRNYHIEFYTKPVWLNALPLQRKPAARRAATQQAPGR